MRTFKSEADGMPGSELLSVLMGPNGSQAKLDGCMARVVTMRAGGGGEVTALVLGPKTAFETELETVGEQTPLTMETTMVKGENYDWFEHWDRMIVWRPKDGPPSDQRSEAELLAALQRRLESGGPRDKSEAVEALCREVFGEHLDDLHAILNGSGEMQEEGDGVTVTVTRPIDPSELAELLARVPKDWMPVLQRSTGWKTAELTDGGDVEAAQARPIPERRRCLYKAAGLLGLGTAAGLFANYLWRSLGSSQRGAAIGDFVLPGTVAKLSAEVPQSRTYVWSAGDPKPPAPCGSGALCCDQVCTNFGSPWAVTYSLAWNMTSWVAADTCRTLCNSPQDTKNLLSERLLTHFFLAEPPSTMSHEEQVQLVQLWSAALTRVCSGAGSPLRNVGTILPCDCDVADVTCDVTTKSTKKLHKVTLTDLETSLARVANSFADYPKDVYDVTNCNFGCWNLTQKAKQISLALKAAAAEAAQQGTVERLNRTDIKHVFIRFG
ncbi:hypothetical protein GNI_154810 [Gregarina niphandrodes]|uniref:Uncharacterized protein n=1 Tax=Gregarina niphandrodes TaxID=110365 RepID=A0A023AZP7_GRENI|nr:hypothetical protein GNI_154810 [Gregarina niphandrodes]EZG43982.1 hypothetical protein GNI_154810 [Gregarina niphandrodes]|eukprot:XP_011132864.1 hypothetical protein GNI_154810 [Gregarina niphandrodes]